MVENTKYPTWLLEVFKRSDSDEPNWMVRIKKGGVDDRETRLIASIEIHRRFNRIIATNSHLLIKQLLTQATEIKLQIHYCIAILVSTNMLRDVLNPERDNLIQHIMSEVSLGNGPIGETAENLLQGLCDMSMLT